MQKTTPVLMFIITLGSLQLLAMPMTNAKVTTASSPKTFYKYLIIAPNNASWINALKPFTSWKTREGLQFYGDYPANCVPVKLTNLTEISDAYGSANASCIRKYIINFWNTNAYGTKLSTLKYVLIVGDVKHVPSYLYNVTIQGNDLTYATDQYYADFYYPAIDQYMNPAVDKTDWNSEVYVGRFPVNNAEELRNVVNKTVTYEVYTDALQHASPGWQRRMLFLGAVMDNGYFSGLSPIWKDGAYSAELIRQNCSDWWMGSSGPIPSPTTLYETNNNPALWSSEYSYLNNLHNLTAANVVDQLNNVGYSAVLSISHGNLQSLQGQKPNQPNNWSPPFFSNSDVYSLRNNYTLPFWFMDACNAGAFQSDLWKNGRRCLGEELLLADPNGHGGVVGFIGSSNLSWYEYYLGAPQNRPQLLSTLSDRFANLTFCELYSGSSSTAYVSSKWGLGRALFEAKRIYNETSWTTGVPEEMHMATCLGFNLLGDPSLQIWSESPHDASSWYSISTPSTVRANERFTVNVNVTTNPLGGSYLGRGPREGAKVCISKTNGNGSVWCNTNLTNSGGVASFTAPAQPGIYNVTITDHPYLIPYLSQIQVLPTVHDVAVTNITTAEATVGQDLLVRINATVQNLGGYDEAFNVTVYANQTKIQTQSTTLTSQATEVLSFLWNTSSFALGTYAIKAEADQVPLEDNTSNNVLTTSYTLSAIPELPHVSVFPLLIFSTTIMMLALKKRKR